MVITTGRDGRTQFHGIENHAVRNMKDAELSIEQARVENDLKRWWEVYGHTPRWTRAIPEVKAEYACLKSEERRINEEIRRREESTDYPLDERHAEFERMIDRDAAVVMLEA